MTGETTERHTIKLYLDAVHGALSGSQHNLDSGFYSIAVNRAYYAVFYTANALLLTKGLTRGKHSGTIGAFRQFFVKPRLIEPEYSEIYGRLMDDRHISDYDVDVIVEPERVETNVQQARQFVERIKVYLTREGLL